eukprot:52045-Eustigmatos_ZCMA.PRE.1
MAMGPRQDWTGHQRRRPEHDALRKTGRVRSISTISQRPRTCLTENSRQTDVQPMGNNAALAVYPGKRTAQTVAARSCLSLDVNRSTPFT